LPLCRTPTLSLFDMLLMLEQLDKVLSLAKGSKWERLWHHPVRYGYATFFQSFIYPFTKKGVLKQAITFFGAKMQVLLPAGTDLYLTGGKTHDSEIRLARFFIKNIQEGDTVLDVGAHFGYFSLLAAALTGKTGAVYAFEASQSTVELLKKNTAGIAHIQVTHQAVSHISGTKIAFFEFPVLFSEYNTTDIRQFEQQRWYKSFPPKQMEVETIALDDLVKTKQLKPVAIKIDVEGAEEEVIKGLQVTLREHHPFIIMEYLEVSRHNQAHRRAHNLLNQLNYCAFTIHQDGFLTACDDPDAYLTAHGMESDNIVYAKIRKG